jgi:hypothetical protein
MYSNEYKNNISVSRHPTESDQRVPRDPEIGSRSGNIERAQHDVDMGAAAWLVVLGAWCSSFCSYGWINSACSTLLTV